MHKPTEREVKLVQRFASLAKARGNRLFDEGGKAMDGGWRSAHSANGWLSVLRDYGFVRKPFFA